MIGLLPKRFDDLNTISNAEYFFHRITNIYEEHKELISELREKDTVIADDVRVFNVKRDVAG